ncbi:hypothetical protein COCCADRAFT_7085 [Bipolaris zeicola 26-R-13]|uniref:Uncharacterized protein n=1 Tax=Cochliobolus carbonum (strain 26-R-13) TaxID=930089 RepID=W6XYZ4_COCC2|nr:uncharacterized protein COCCADRAFT_7085 [Bipolaris zeicola 26-R-13]EUC30963.1 hypothetical protein COCCADRAFT_7085 [Bipolaris zeicola 26-R-13]
MPPARIPRLRYRNPLPSASLPKSFHGSGPHPAYSTQEPPVAPDPNSNLPSTLAPSPSQPALVTSSSLASLHSSTSSSGNDSKSSKKKKKTSSVLGFLSLKEPSQAALDQIVQQQRKQNSGSSTPPSATYHASQKLPPHVPKVNSKWDGVPESVKQRHSPTSNPSTKDNRSSVSSKSSFGSHLKTRQWNHSDLSIMTDGTRNPPNSIASVSVSNLPRHETATGLGSSPSTATFPNASPYLADGPLTPTSLHSPSFSTQMADRSNFQSTTNRPLDSPSGSRPSMDGSIHSRPHSPASSTTSADTITMDTADTIFRKMNDRPSQGTLGREAPVAELQDRSKPDIVPESHDFLFQPQPQPSPAINTRSIDLSVAYSRSSDEFIPPYSPVRPVQNFSRPTAPAAPTAPTGPPPVQRNTFMAPYRRPPQAPALPTLYESSLASTDESEDDDDNGDARSIAPSTIAPSELSLHWYESPRERLGLGRRLQINDVLPWDEQRGGKGKPKKSRLLVFGRSSSK